MATALAIVGCSWIGVGVSLAIGIPVYVGISLAILIVLGVQAHGQVKERWLTRD